MITSIGRYFQINPNIVGIITDDDLATITTTGYLTDENDNIVALNSGEFEWLDTDVVLIAYDGGIGLFTRDATNETFVAIVQSIQAGSITLAQLSTGIAPSDVVKFADQETTVGGAAAEAFTVNGVDATDLAFVQVVDNGTNNVTVLQAACTLNTLTVTFSADPGADCIFNYQILRAAS